MHLDRTPRSASPRRSPRARCSRPRPSELGAPVAAAEVQGRRDHARPDGALGDVRRARREGRGRRHARRSTSSSSRARSSRVVGTPQQPGRRARRVTGRKQFAMDLDVPDALPTMVCRPPTINGTAQAVANLAAVKAMPGVTDVAVISHTGVGGVACAQTFGQCIDADPRAATSTGTRAPVGRRVRRDRARRRCARPSCRCAVPAACWPRRSRPDVHLLLPPQRPARDQLRDRRRARRPGRDLVRPEVADRRPGGASPRRSGCRSSR